MHPVLAEILGGPDLLIVLAIVLVLFGGAKLPELARSIGRAKHEFEDAASTPRSDAPDEDPSRESRDH